MAHCCGRRVAIGKRETGAKINASMATGRNHDLLNLKIRNMLADTENADLTKIEDIISD